MRGVSAAAASVAAMLPLLLLLLLALAATPTLALFEEHAGVTDWQLSHVGSIQSVLFRESGQGVVVSTHSGVVASLSVGGTGADVASGELRWRQVLPSGERVLAIGAYSKIRMLSVSAAEGEEDATVRAWSSKDGSLAWETTLEHAEQSVASRVNASAPSRFPARVQGMSWDIESESAASTDPFAHSFASVGTIKDQNADGKSDVLVVAGDTVAVLNGVDGVVLWRWTQPGFRGIRAGVRNGMVAVAGLHEAHKGAVRIYALKQTDGSVVHERSVPFAPAPTTRNLIVLPFSASVLLLDPASRVLRLLALFEKSAGKDTEFDLQAESGMRAPSHMELLGTNADSSFIGVYAADRQLVLDIPQPGGWIHAKNLFSTAPASASSDVELSLAAGPLPGDSTVLVRAVLTNGKLSVDSFPVEEGSAAPATALVASQPFAHRGGLKQVWAEFTPSAAKAQGVRLLVSAVDESFSLFDEQGKQSWVREEALAHVRSLQFVELPVSSDTTQEEGGKYPGFFARILPQVQGLVGGFVGLVNPQLVLNKVQAGVASINATVQAAIHAANGQQSNQGIPGTATRSTFARPLSADARDSLLRQDYFGFRKLLLVSTGSGKVYALESQSGHIVWGRFMKLGNKAAATDHEEDEQVTPVWRVHVLSHHEAVAIVHDDEKNAASGSHIIAFNPLTGDLARDQPARLSFRASTTLLLPFIDSHNRHVLLVAAADGQSLVSYPNTQEVVDIVRAKGADVFFFTVDTAAQVVRGFKLDVSKAQGTNSKLAAQQSWLVRFPSASERIAAVSTRPAHEVIQSGVRVLGGGDGGFLFKYLNPNLLALATVRPPPGQQGQAGAAQQRLVPSLKRTTDPSVNIYLIDSITGAVLDKLVHRGGEGPVSLLQSENSVLAHFYNSHAGTYEISSMELFENREGNSGAGSVGATGVIAGASSIFDGLTLGSVASLLTLGSGRVQPFNSFVEPPPQTLQQTFTFKSSLRTFGVSQTRRGITSKEYLLGLPSSQLYALPKVLVDPRRPLGEPTLLEKMEGLIPYSAELPVDKLRMVSHARIVEGLAGGIL